MYDAIWQRKLVIQMFIIASGSMKAAAAMV
jgi:hypothetical protein